MPLLDKRFWADVYYAGFYAGSISCKCYMGIDISDGMFDASTKWQ